MGLTVDHDESLEILLGCYHKSISNKKDKGAKNKKTKSVIPLSDLEFVFCNSHKTFKYILLTGILAYSSNREVNPRALQSSAGLDGYDARSLCHDVIVPFEREYLEGKLGASNEPFLNKPARFPTLADDNPVRGGNDKEIMLRTIGILEKLKFCTDPKEVLTDALIVINTIQNNKVAVPKLDNMDLLTSNMWNSAVDKLLEQNCLGESLTFAVALTLEMISQSTRADWKIIVGHSNQSGSSSKENADIEVVSISDNRSLYFLELKDKPYAQHDIQHAIDKVKLYGGNSIIFVEGPRANLQTSNHEQLIEENKTENFHLRFMNIEELKAIGILIGTSIPFDDFEKLLNQRIKSINPHQNTLIHIQTWAESFSETTQH